MYFHRPRFLSIVKVMPGENKKIKVLFLITRSHWGGAQRYVFDLATNLPQEKFEAVVITGGNGPLIQKLQEARIKTIIPPALARDISIGGDLKTFWQIKKIIRNENPDFVHLNSSKIGILGALAARLCGVRNVIFTAHGWAFNEDRPFFIKIIFRVMVWFSFFLHTRVICVSEAVRSSAPILLLPKEKFVTIHLGISPISHLERDAARKFLMQKDPRLEKLDAQTPWIGIVAELTHNKGITYAIQALQIPSLLAAHLILIGSGDLEHSLKSLTHALHSNDRIHFLGAIENAALYLQAFDVFALPSLTEALGYVLLEAGSAQLPVAASRVGGIPEIIENNTNGFLVPPKNPLALADAIDTLLKNPELAQRFSHALKEKVKNNFSLAGMLGETFALYEKLLG